MRFRDEKELPDSGSKNFLRLKDRESVEGVFRGEIAEMSVIWGPDKKPTIVPEGTPGSKFQFRINFVIKEGAVYVPKIFQQGITVYKQLSELHKEYGLDETVIKISRNGLGTDTTYSLLPLLKKALTKEVLAHFKELDLLPLESGQSKTNSLPGALDDHEDDPPF